ncbi:hypothetical protein SLEP1_g6495 [Rubroshorea leprosula]|uniref:GYF domain-containing protein n=2 Tax=Rubroshorea leprosula TaxID=152421 RepID=A0AAV5I195_9ROSI|nr:hypothetical protein SLEP1_g6495 [Rubroshorea leprosula]
MAEGKSDLPEDLLSLKPSDRSWTGKVDSLGGNDEKIDEPKDQMGSESSIPLSPQWLYAKPSETKMDSRGPPFVSLGNPPDPNQKEAGRLDGSQDKKDWRRIVTENESNRRWREEERETGLLSRRDRRKGERRIENVSSRETTDGRAMSSSDRWHDGSIRNTGYESRRDNKWSSRWGPEEKEKESHTTEKRTDTEKEKDDNHNENQSFVGSNRPTSDRDPDSSRDKWRPRHRIEVHSGGSTTSRAAPGFGLERGKVESNNLGFTVGRGRGRSSSASPIGAAHSLKDESIPGKPKFPAATFCYPRGKLLDIYRWQKLDTPSFAAISDGMDEVPPITQVGLVEPLAFVPPDSEEEGILNDIWKGKITGSGVVYNSFRQGRTSGNVSEAGDSEYAETKQGMLSHILTGETIDTLQEAAVDDPYKACSVGSSSNNEMYLNLVAGKEVTIVEEFKVSSAALQSNAEDAVENATSFDTKAKILDEKGSLFLLGSSDQNHGSNEQHLDSNEANSLGLAPEELTLFYIDPRGNTQGPFLGADIISWFKQGFFGTDLLVRLADSPEGTHFQKLGEIMPHLQVEDKHANIDDLNYMLEQSGSLGGNLEAMHTSGPITKSIELSTEKLFRASSKFNGHSAQHVQSKISEPEVNLQMQQSEGQSFEETVAQDEEIVFPGRSGNVYPISKSSQSIHSPLINSGSHPSLPNELTESSTPNENDNKLHRFGLLWSELEGTQTRHTQSSNVPSGVGRSAPFSTMVDPVLAGETWSDIYGKHTFPDSNIYQDALAAAHMSRVERESNNFDLTERLLSQQLQQQQLHPQNMLSPHARLNESLLEHLPSQNLIHQQQLSNQSVPDLEHLLALQMQQRRQLQLQQQFHKEQKLLQERQQSQVQQAFLEQLFGGQIPAPGPGQSFADPIRSSNVLDQVLLERQLLHEIQQQSHHASRHFVPSLDQLVQAKFGQAPQEEHQRDLYDLISHAQHGQLQSLEHMLLRKEQLQRQLSMGLKQHNEERDINSLWPADQTNQFLRKSAGINRVQPLGFSPLDLYQQQPRPSHEEQLSHLEQNLSIQELRQGLYEHSLSPFERSMSLPAGASAINMDVVNAMAHVRGLDIDEPSTHLRSAGQVGTFSSGLHTHNPHHLLPNQYNASQEGQWVESNGQMENDWMESRIQQLQINAERQKRDLGVKMPSENSSAWMSDGLNDDKSRQLLMELLHQKSGHQTSKSSERDSSGIYCGSGSLDHPLSVLAEQEASLNNSIPVGSYGSSSSEAQQIYFADEPAGSFEGDERLQFRPGSGVMSERERFLSRTSDNAQSIYGDANMTGMLSMNKELSDGEWMNQESKSQGTMKGSAFEVHDGMIKQGGLTFIGERDVPVNVLSRHSSLGVTGGNASAYSNQIGLINSYVEDVAKDRVQVPDKAQDNMLLRRPPVHASSSHEGLSELVSDPASRGKNSLSSNDGGKRDPGGNIGSQGSDTTAKKEARFRHTSSYGEGDVSEASFIDMLKSNSKKSAVPEAHATTGAESSDGTQGGRSGKKKGKKGRQIDPALLGFKVTSNRIMMGEIQRLED